MCAAWVRVMCHADTTKRALPVFQLDGLEHVHENGKLLQSLRCGSVCGQVCIGPARGHVNLTTEILYGADGSVEICDDVDLGRTLHRNWSETRDSEHPSDLCTPFRLHQTCTSTCTLMAKAQMYTCKYAKRKMTKTFIFNETAAKTQDTKRIYPTQHPQDAQFGNVHKSTSAAGTQTHKPPV